MAGIFGRCHIGRRGQLTGCKSLWFVFQFKNLPVKIGGLVFVTEVEPDLTAGKRQPGLRCDVVAVGVKD